MDRHSRPSPSTRNGGNVDLPAIDALRIDDVAALMTTVATSSNSGGTARDGVQTGLDLLAARWRPLPPGPVDRLLRPGPLVVRTSSGPPRVAPLRVVAG